MEKKSYSLEKIIVKDRNPSHQKRIKRLLKKSQRAIGKVTKDQILLFFELGKKMG